MVDDWLVGWGVWVGVWWCFFVVCLCLWLVLYCLCGVWGVVCACCVWCVCGACAIVGVVCVCGDVGFLWRGGVRGRCVGLWVGAVKWRGRGGPGWWWWRGWWWWGRRGRAVGWGRGRE